MIAQFIGGYCLAHVVMLKIALIASIVQNDEDHLGSRARANFIAIGYLAVAAWCFK